VEQFEAGARARRPGVQRRSVRHSNLRTGKRALSSGTTKPRKEKRAQRLSEERHRAVEELVEEATGGSSDRTPEGAVIGACGEQTDCSLTRKEGGGWRRSMRRKGGTALAAHQLGQRWTTEGKNGGAELAGVWLWLRRGRFWACHRSALPHSPSNKHLRVAVTVRPSSYRSY
jgi:hypothetical protein